MSKKVMYFDNPTIQPWVMQYQEMDPSTEEAKILSNKIMIQVKKIIEAVIFTHQLFKKRHMDLDLCIDIGLEHCFKALPKFDPTKTKKNGKPTDFFTFMSIVAKMSITNHAIRLFYTHRHTISIDVIDAMTFGYLPSTYEDDHEDPPSLRQYAFLFTDEYHLTAFNLIADYVEEDAIHLNKRAIIKVLRQDYKKFTMYNGRTAPDDHYAAHLMRNVFNKIRQYERTGVVPVKRRRAQIPSIS